MLKKLLVSAVLTMPLSSAMAGQGEIQSIDQLRELCRNLESNEQVKFFDKGLLCKGSHTVWKKREDRAELPNQGSIFARTSYDKCDTPLTTPGEQALFESRYNAAECHIYDKYRVLAPQVPVFVNSCDELTAENVERLCRDAISDHCFDPCDASADQCGTGKGGVEGDEAQQQQQQQEQEPGSGACMMEKVGSFNSCDLYDRGCAGKAPTSSSSLSSTSLSSSSN
ncbi:MAG: hypothetical protein HRU09_16950 [Oligoflexales bacterium]|nr:hypothetical protein [Oligoflexales bacterium]